MPFYNFKYSVEAAKEIEKEVEVRGSEIDYLAVKFPAGCFGLLEVSIFYGLRQIYPDKDSPPFSGDNETLESFDIFKLPEELTKLKIIARNKDDTYSHSFFLRIRTKPVEKLPKVKFRHLEMGMVEIEI